jgi:hypothetical protein
MCCARAKVSMTSIGAPQCRHTKVGLGGSVIGAAIVRLCGRRQCRLMQKFASGRDVGLAVGVGEQTVVTDAVEATGQHVQQESAHEL